MATRFGSGTSPSPGTETTRRPGSIRWSPRSRRVGPWTGPASGPTALLRGGSLTSPARGEAGGRGAPVVVKVGSSSVTTPGGQSQRRAHRPAVHRDRRSAGLGARRGGGQLRGHRGGVVGPRPSRTTPGGSLGAPSGVGRWPAAADERLAGRPEPPGPARRPGPAGPARLRPSAPVPPRPPDPRASAGARGRAGGERDDVVADEEIRFGDNDRLAALVAHLVRAELLVLLTDAPGLFTADPRTVQGASLIEEVVEDRPPARRGGWRPGHGDGQRRACPPSSPPPASPPGRACRRSSPTRSRPGSLAAVLTGEPGVGTVFRPRARRLPARKLWIAFATSASGALAVDDGRAGALVDEGRSLLAAGVRSVRGSFGPDDAGRHPERGRNGLRQGRPGLSSGRADQWVGRRSDALPKDLPSEVVHRDDRRARMSGSALGGRVRGGCSPVGTCRAVRVGARAQGVPGRASAERSPWPRPPVSGPREDRGGGAG